MQWAMRALVRCTRTHAWGSPSLSPGLRPWDRAVVCPYPCLCPVTRSMPHRLGSCFPSAPNRCSFLEPGAAPLGWERLCIGGRTWAYCGERRERMGSGVLIEWWCRSDAAINSRFVPLPLHVRQRTGGFFFDALAPSVSPPFANTYNFFLFRIWKDWC
ncbi:hypothetical protein B0H13DRAFT_557304 [Mycena leptocephala]|nr:hypothetical protein B0H13DRAFT_557304 [Mycena leptocephala]